jgi:hypothetical protein
MSNNKNKITPLSPLQNQLIYLVLMIILVSLAVGLAIAFGASSLDNGQRWLLTIFLLLFPTAGLGLSIWLILRHNRKLAVGTNDEDFSWQLMNPEQQRRKLNIEVNMLAALMPNQDYLLSDLRSAYIVAEDLALRNIEQEQQVPLMRHVLVEGVPFDGVAFKQDKVYCVDVTFCLTPHLSQEKATTFLDKVDYAAKRIQKLRPGSKMHLIVALVTQLSPEGEVRLKNSLVEKFSGASIPAVDIQLLDFENLQNNFTAE